MAKLSQTADDLQERNTAAKEFIEGEELQADRRPEKRRRESPPASPCRARRQPSPQPMRLLLPHERQTPSQQLPLPRAGKQKCGPYKMDDDDTTDEPTSLNSEEEKEMISFTLEASQHQQREDRDRSRRWGESSSSHSLGWGHGSLAARIEGVPGSGTVLSLQTHIGGSAGAPVQSSHSTGRGITPFEPICSNTVQDTNSQPDTARWQEQVRDGSGKLLPTTYVSWVCQEARDCTHLLGQTPSGMKKPLNFGSTL